MSFSNRYITIAIPGLFVVLSLTVVASFQTDKKMLLAVLPALGLGLFVHSLYYFTVKPQILAAAGLILTGALITLGGFGLISLDRNRRLSPTIGIQAISLLVCLALNFFGVSNWLMGRNNGQSILEDAETSRRGLLLKQATTPDTLIAYARAGAMPYFAERKAIDLPGKNDRVIAKGPPVAEFVPGHNKWNYAYSIGQLKPDLISDLWQPTESDKKMLSDWGYVSYKGGFGGTLYLRKNSTNKVNMALFSQP